MSGFKKRAVSDTTPLVAKLSSKVDYQTQAKLDAIADSTNPKLTSPVSALKPSVPISIDADVINVSLGQLRENAWNSRQIFSQADHEEMVRLLESQGQLDDCAGYRDGTNIVLLSGHRRLRAATALRWQTLRIRLVEAPKDDLEAFVRSDQYNVGHKAQSILDRALAFAKLIDSRAAMGPQDIAARCKLEESYVVKVLALAKLPEQVMSMLSEVPQMMVYSVLYEIYLFHKDLGLAETMKLLATIAEVPLSLRDVAGRRKLLKEGRKPKPRSARSIFTYAGAKGELKRFDSEGRLELSVKGLSQDSLAELEIKLANLVHASPELQLVTG